MSICIVSATALELQSLPRPANNTQFHTLITGVGTAATVYQLMHFLQNNKPSLMIQAGIAGCFDQTISLGQPMLIYQDRFADLGVQENNQWSDIFDMQLAPEHEHPYTRGWLINPYQELLSEFQLPLVKSISINEVTTHASRIQQLKEKYDPAVESMEGAAFHYVCLQQKIPFIQLRTVSNYVGERNKDKWQLKPAIDNLAKQLQTIVNKFSYLQLPNTDWNNYA